jgi:hypothetical protein
LKIGELTLSVLLAAVLSLEGWQLYEITSLRADLAVVQAKVDMLIQKSPIADSGRN